MQGHSFQFFSHKPLLIFLDGFKQQQIIHLGTFSSLCLTDFCLFLFSSDPECREEDEFFRLSETSICLRCCPSPTVIRPQWGSICCPEFHPSPLSRSLPSLLPSVVAIREGRKGESAPVNMPGWRSQWRLILLNSLTCGLEICVAAGITYVPPLLLEAGVEERYMTMVLGKGLLKTE